MSGADRLPLAKRALEVLTRQLRPTDTVALVTYAGSAEIVLGPTPADRQSKILNAISSLTTGGGTITVASTVGVGTTFTVRMLRAAEAGAAGTRPVSAAE